MEKQEQRPLSEQSFSGVPEVTLEKIASYSVFDKNNRRIGTASAIWADRTRHPAFVGVKTTWLFGKTHIVPAYGAEVNHAMERIRLAYLEEDVKDAPAYSPDAALGVDREREIFTYYRGRGVELPKWEEPPKMQEAANITPMPQQAGFKQQERRAEPKSKQGFKAQEARAATASEEATIPLHEESVKFGKRMVETGGVRLHKVVRVEKVQQPVELKHEELIIERVPGGEGKLEGKSLEKAFQGEEDIYIPLRREEAVIEKETHVRERVHARKATSTEQQTFSEEIRKEDIEVEKQQQRKVA